MGATIGSGSFNFCTKLLTKAYGGDTRTFSRGTLTITHLDLATGIIAGTFDFKLAKLGCDTLRVTQGRFDGKM